MKSCENLLCNLGQNVIHGLETCHIVARFPDYTKDSLDNCPTIYTVILVWKDVVISEGFQRSWRVGRTLLELSSGSVMYCGRLTMVPAF